MDMKIADRLYSLRKEHGYSQDELADLLNVSRQAVSKWERGESAPDTDNLIALARLYDISIDELLGHNPKNHQENSKADGHDFTHQDDASTISINEDGIKIGDTIIIDKNGIDVNTEKIKINVGSKDKPYIFEKDDAKLRKLILPISCATLTLLTITAYLVMGFVAKLWHPGWLVFFAIPIYNSFVDTIIKKDATQFPIAMIAVLAFLILGLIGGWWHPGWVVLLSIPVYYSIASPLSKYCKAKRNLQYGTNDSVFNDYIDNIFDNDKDVDDETFDKNTDNPDNLNTDADSD